MERRRYGSLGVMALVMVLLVPGASRVAAQDAEPKVDPWESSLPTLLRDVYSRRAASRRDSREVLQLFEPIAKSVAASVVSVYDGDQPVAWGLVVRGDGMIVTKASELTGSQVRVRLSDRRMYDATVIAHRRSEDLALLRCTAKDLTPIVFKKQEPAIGSFLVSVGATGNAVGLGVVGNELRAVAEQGILGVGFRPAEQGVTVTGVLPGSGAAVAGVEEGDLIISVNGKPVTNGNILQEEIKRLFPGDRAKVVVIRGGDEMNMDVQIRDISVVHETESDARVHGSRSGRLAGFDRVISHDTVLEPNQCGGPILNLEGEVVGMNIARAGRVVSFALPGAMVDSLVRSMISEVTN